MTSTSVFAHMRRVFAYELRRNFQRRGFLFTAFGLPIIAFVLFFVVQTLTQRANEQAVEDLTEQAQEDFGAIQNAGYVDESGFFEQTDAVASAIRRYDSEAEAQAAMDSGEIDLYYIIQPDYLETGNVTAVIPEFSVSLLNVVDEPVRQLFFSQFAENVDPAVLNRLQTPTTVQEITFDRDAESGQARNEDSDFVLVYGFAIIFTMALFGTNGYLMQSVIEEKETRLVEILVTSVRPLALLGGKILALGVLGIVQVVAWLGTIFVLSSLASQITDSSSPLLFLQGLNVDVGTILLLLVYFIVGYVFFAAVFAMIGALSVSLTEGPSYATLFTLPLFLPFLFLTAFIDAPNSTGPLVLSLAPVTSLLSMPMRLAVIDVPLWQIGLSVGIMVLVDIFMIWMAGRLFRFQTLLAGSVPKLKDLPALIRG
ncbi:MAG: ABC transporter permease [bacterium]|nr:ABC transporter permease [bacterium]